MVASVLPMYLVLHLNLSPLAFGALDGLYNGMTAVTRWAGGVMADRWRRYKEVAAIGYAVSAGCRLGLLAAGSSSSGLAIAIGTERLGKGLRTAPRDAMISLSAPPSALGQSFGVHRALDATGAMLGPVTAFALLALVPRGFDVVFVTSFCVAVVGLGVLLLFVDTSSAPAAPEDAAPAVSLRAAFGLLRRRDFRIVTVVAGGLALVTISDPFIYLALQDRLRVNPGMFPLLYVGTSLSFLLLAVPAGAVADRFGRLRVFLVGHGALLLVYASLMTGTSSASVLLAVALLGAYYAATDGVVVAMASAILPAALRGSGLAVLTTATSVARLIASIAFGWVWTTLGRDTAIGLFALALGIAATVATIVLRRGKWSLHE
jgi:MFS family permease